MDTKKEKIRLILSERRKELGLTMKELSSLVGVSEATISRWESGDIANMRRDRIASLAEALKISPAVIMGWENSSSSSDSQAVTPANPSEARLLYLYRGLNSIGQTKLNEYAEDLSANEKYQLRVHDGVSESSITYKDSVDYSDLPMVAEEQAKYGEEAI